MGQPQLPKASFHPHSPRFARKPTLRAVNWFTHGRSRLGENRDADRSTKCNRSRRLIIVSLVCTLISLPALPGRADAFEDIAPVTRERCGDATTGRRPVWKTVTIGAFKDYFRLRNALDEAEIAVGTSADEILARPSFETSPKRINYELVIYSANDLGFKEDRVPQSQIYERARCAGLQLCATEIAPMLRLAYREQPLNEVIIVAMEARRTYEGEPVVLSLAHFATGAKRKGLMLLGGDGRPETKISRTTPFVFVRPQEVAVKR